MILNSKFENENYVYLYQIMNDWICSECNTDYEEYEDSMIWCGGIKICAVINVDHIAVDLVTQDLT